MSVFRSFVHVARVRNVISHRYLSSVSADKLETSSIPQWSLNDITTNATGLQFRDYLKTHFTPSTNDIYKVRNGSFMPFSKAEVDTYLPEGLPFEQIDDIPPEKDGMWMVRESSKLVCRLIDEWEKTLVKSTPSEPFSRCTVVPYAKVDIPKFTDRTEWQDTRLKCFYYGDEIATQFEKDPAVDFNGNSGDLEGKHTLTEKVVERIDIDKVNNILLTGKRGVGKSVVLYQAVMHARKRGWLCLFVPNAWDQIHSGPFVEPFFTGENLYDNQFMSKDVLRNFWLAHHKELATIPIKVADTTKYPPFITQFYAELESVKELLNIRTVDKNFVKVRALVQQDENVPDEDALDDKIIRDVDLTTYKFETLEDLVKFGIIFSETSGVVFKDLLEEIKRIDHIPVLVAVDQYNSWFNEPSFSYDDKDIETRQLAVPHCLQLFPTKKVPDTSILRLKNGFTIAATCMKHHQELKKVNDGFAKQLPLKIEISNYNKIEYLSMFSYYINYSMIEPNLKLDDFILYRMFTSSIPYLVQNNILDYFLPKILDNNEELFENALIESVSLAQGTRLSGKKGLEEVRERALFDSLHKRTDDDDNEDAVVDNTELFHMDAVNLEELSQKVDDITVKKTNQKKGTQKKGKK